jgi:hypothetical protein
MTLRAITALALLTCTLPAASAAQVRTAADYRAAIEGAQASPGPDELGSSWRASTCPA